MLYIFYLQNILHIQTTKFSFDYFLFIHQGGQIFECKKLGSFRFAPKL